MAAISDIPATRLLGRAPEGMNSSGDSQQTDWKKLVKAKQELDLAPCLDRMDPWLLQSALGSAPDGYWWEFAPLDTPDQSEVATRFKTEMEAIERLQVMAAIPERAFNEAVQSKMIEEGYLPGLEAALMKIPDDERWGVEPDLSLEPVNSGKEVDPASAGQGGETPDTPPAVPEGSPQQGV